MAIIVEEKCSRCRRNIKHAVEGVQQAVEVDALRVKREENAKLIEDFVRNMKPEELPALMVVQRLPDGYKVLSLPTLCDVKEEGKRSCTGRITELAEAMDELGERKKPVRKAKAVTGD